MQAYAQQNITEVIDSLHAEFTLYPDRDYHLPRFFNDTIPPPIKEALRYEIDGAIEAYAIPSEVIMQYYPWNADSISITFDLQERPRIGEDIKLTEQDIKELIDILYKFEFKGGSGYISINTIALDTPIPNFRLTFYNGEKSFFADFYKHGENNLKIIDSSCGDPYPGRTNVYNFEEWDNYENNIYWGTLFHITFQQLATFIEKRFAKDVHEGLYEYGVTLGVFFR